MSKLKQSVETARIVSVIAATITSLACGTGYAYSAWGPAFAERMVLSSTQSNLIGVFGNFGMYGAGIPLGYMVDSRGPRLGSLVGCVMMGLGYFALNRAYVNGPGSLSLPLLCLATFVAGCGGSAAFAGSVKTAAVNFPKSRGTATACPMAAFGLSAFFFSLVSSLALPNDTAGFLLFLSIGCACMIAVPAPFLRILPHAPVYSVIPSEANERRSEDKLSRPRRRDASAEPGTRSQSTNRPGSAQTGLLNDTAHDDMPELSKLDTEDSNHAAVDMSNKQDPDDDDSNHNTHGSLYADVRGFKLLRTVEFYQLFTIIGVLTGVGLMTINNIGNDAEALWIHWDEKTPVEWIRHRQSMHVSIISVASFAGRLCSGIGSDIIVEKLHMSRIWCFVVSSSLFTLAQVFGMSLENPNFLFVLSTLSGLAYGFLFGVGPSIVVETFGPNGLSQNWGTMTLSPIIFADVFNLMYGTIFDHHSKVLPSGHRECMEGRGCYKDAYWMTFISSAVAIVFCLWSIHHGHKVREQRKESGDQDHIA